MVSRNETGIAYTDSPYPDHSSSTESVRERVTVPDLERVVAAEQTRERAKKLSGSHVRAQEIVSEICGSEQFEPDKLKRIASGTTGSVLTFAEYRSPGNTTSYLYVTPGCALPSSIICSRWVQEAIPQLKTPVLFRISYKGDVAELRHWDD